MESHMEFYHYQTEKDGRVSAKGTYQEDNGRKIPFEVLWESNGIWQVFSEHPFDKETQETIIKAFQMTLKLEET